MKKYFMFIFIIAVTLLSGCAHNSADELEQKKHSARVWPEPPASPKIKFIQAFSTPAELGIGRSFWQWLGDVVFGSDNIHMVRPMAVVSVADNLIFVADPGVKGVHRFNMRDQSYQLIQAADELALPSPVSLAVDKQGNVYISDSALAQVFIVRKNSDVAEPFEVNVALQQPTGIAIERNSGDMYLVDTLQHQVLVFNANGKIKKRIGQRGLNNGEFNFPTHLQINHQRLLISDSLNFRVQILKLNGEFISVFGEAGQVSGYLSRPKGVAMDKLGHVYVVDGLQNKIQLFDLKGRLLMAIGEQGLQPGQFWLPTGIYINEQQKIYVADSHNRRVQVFRYLGDAI